MNETPADSIGPALEAWGQALGAEHVTAGAAEREAAGAATYRTTQRVLAIVRPGSRDEVAACVRIANQFGIPLYPVSTGKNWGYGSRVPAHDGSVVLDLRRMNRIVELDEELAYVVVEPGVTQRQLYDYLQERTGGRLWLDATSASFESSLIGNLLERGHGVTMYCDHVACSANYEVVLPTGEFVRTGYGALPGASVSHVDQWGLGPALMGLFSQSNFGVVTRATIWLMRAPERAAVAFFAIDDEKSFAAVVDEVRALRLDRILKSGPFFGNVYQAIQKVMTYPWHVTGGATPLPIDVAQRLAAEHRYGLWSGSVGLCGTESEVAEQKERLARALAGRASWTAIVDPDLRDLESTFPPSRHGEVRSVIAGFTGGVGGTGLKAAYWRMGGPPADLRDIDLDRDRCGFRFLTATTPFRGREALEVTSTATEIVLRHGFEPSIGVFPVRERKLHYHIACAYDRKVPGADEAIDACHAELGAALADKGHYPSRLGIGSMHVVDRCDDDYLRLLDRLREAFDPKGIMAPNRYAAARRQL